MSNTRSSAFSRQPRARKTKTRQVRKIFIIVVEGETEKEYFSSSVFKNSKVKIIPELGKSSNPEGLISSINEKIEELKQDLTLQGGDPAWLVLDDDNRPAKEREQLFKWKDEHRSRNIAFTSPQFEYWLILHFADGNGICTKKECLDEIVKYIPGYKKGKANQLPTTVPKIEDAIKRAEKRLPQPLTTNSQIDNQPSSFTSVHHLTKQILDNLT
ncbi:RloB family protein [Corynebacterium variabile]|uniref:RloB family protein n=1 Tax=Corynebacterium variabile TaxID=1727 RepID=UPI003A906332